MIYDNLNYARLYEKLHPLFPAAFDYLRRFDVNTPLGRYELKGADLIALVQTYQTETPARKAYESHRKYIDLQCVISGNETIYYVPITRLTSNKPYDFEKDVEFYEGSDTHPIVLSSGEWTILYPHDGHKPGCIHAHAQQVLKVVLKIRV